MKNTSVYIHINTLKGVLEGDAEARSAVGCIRDNEAGTIVSNLYVHFDKATGAPRLTPDGRLRLNARPVLTREEKTSRDLNSILAATGQDELPAGAVEPEADVEDVLR